MGVRASTYLFLIMEGAKIVSSAILGMDIGTCVVNNKAYFIKPLTIKKLAGMGLYLNEIGEGESVRDILWTLSSDKPAHALSWAINGDDSLFEELSNGTFEEVVDGLEVAFSTIKTENFMKLSLLRSNSARVIANPKS